MKKTNSILLKLSVLKAFINSHITLLSLPESVTETFKRLINNQVEQVKDHVKSLDIEDHCCIYTITTMTYSGDRKRTPGFSFEFLDVEQAVKHNIDDIYEGRYVYAIIERVVPGIYTFDEREEFWYKYNPEKDQYEAIPKPNKFQRAICWGIG